mmetsp:Transcript_11717/g.38563  ORF Transcript_11717/g.38563 Transcript_11717/m.38563 type:complete len:151 (-) Transcript_11717:156-608(-)
MHTSRRDGGAKSVVRKKTVVKTEGRRRVGVVGRMKKGALRLLNPVVSYFRAWARVRAQRRDIALLERQLLRELRHKAMLEDLLAEQVPRKRRKKEPRQRILLIPVDADENWFGTPGTHVNNKDAELHCWGSKGHVLGDGKPKVQVITDEA